MENIKIEREKIESSQIASRGYNEEHRILEIEFKNNGAIYRYYDVPAKTYHYMKNAESEGSFFHQNIRKGGFRYEKVTV